jgi:hypothetical protein
MMLTPKNRVVDSRTLKLLVGLIAIFLPLEVWLFSTSPLLSISASYYQGGWAQEAFLGSGYAICALMLVHNGRTPGEMIASKIAAVAAFVIAWNPCGCIIGSALDNPWASPPHESVHDAAALTQFLMLAYFCFSFWRTARRKGHKQAIWRSWFYALCGVLILGSIVASAVAKQSASSNVFCFEAVGLLAFGVSWLLASRTIPGITAPHEQFWPLRGDNPPDE